MSNGIYYIYKITNIINNKIYIGFTSTTPFDRYKEHIYCASKTTSTNTIFYNAIRKYGKENFIVEELDRSDDYDYCLNVLEPKYIKEYNSTDKNIGYNMSKGGGGLPMPSPFSGQNYVEIYGQEKAEEIKAKIKEHHYDCSGKNNSFYGKHHSEETKAKLREYRLKQDLSCNKKKFIIYDKNNNIVFNGQSIVEFTLKNGFKYTSALTRFAVTNRPIKTLNKSFKFNGYYIKYVT